MAHWSIIVFSIRLAICLPGTAPWIWQDNNPTQETMTMEYHPIGKFHSNLTPQSGAPRQGILQPDNEATIEIYDQYTKALMDLEKYDYIIVIYHMHLSLEWNSDVRPPGSKRPLGLFATRSPNRPNPIGIGVIKLNRIKGNTLHVSGIDAFNGTPVLDIKPWIPSIDCPSYQTNPDNERDLGLKKGGI